VKYPSLLRKLQPREGSFFPCRWNPLRVLAGLWLGLSLPVSAAGQLPELPLSLEVQVGGILPLGDWEVRDRPTTLGVGGGALLSGVLRMELSDRFSAYGSYRWSRPSCEECGLFTLDDSLRDAGFGLGVGVDLPGALPGDPRLDLGGIFHQLAFRGDGETRPSEWGIGAEIGMTLSFPLFASVFLEPALAGVAYPARFEFEDDTFREVAVRYVAARIGLRYAL